MKIETSRRKFLVALGLAAPVAPMVAKAAVEKELSDLSGIKLGAAMGNIGPYTGMPGDAMTAGGIDVMDAADQFVKVFGLPEHIKVNLAKRSQEVHAIDPDIAVKRSWSFAVKVQAQRERNLEKLKQGMADGIAQTRREKAFRALTGFNWPFYY